MFLIIDSTGVTSTAFRRKFYNAGSFAVFATTKNYASVISSHDIWAIIFPNPENIPAINEFATKLAEKYNKPLIFMKNEDSHKIMYDYLVDNGYVTRIIPAAIPSRRLVDILLEIVADRGCRYAYAKTAACVRYNRAFPRNTVKVFSREIKLNNTEFSVLHYLIHQYPKPVPANEIMSVAFRPETKAAHNNVATQISKINSKLLPLCGYRLISCTYKKGYVISSKNSVEISEFPDFRKIYDFDGE